MACFFQKNFTGRPSTSLFGLVLRLPVRGTGHLLPAFFQLHRLAWPGRWCHLWVFLSFWPNIFILVASVFIDQFSSNLLQSQVNKAGGGRLRQTQVRHDTSSGRLVGHVFKAQRIAENLLAYLRVTVSIYITICVYIYNLYQSIDYRDAANR